MQVESYYPFLLVIAPFALAYFSEALVIYLFRLKRFWPALGIAVLSNVFSLLVLYGCSWFLGRLGFPLNGLLLPVQVVLFFWWLSVLTDGLMLQLFKKDAPTEKIYWCSIVMNSFSWLFLYFFILYK